MILRNAGSKRAGRIISWLFTVLALTMVGGTIIYLFYPTSSGKNLNRNSIYCDAEKVVGENFINGKLVFPNGHLQNDRVARSGNYSCKVEKGNGAQYGFSFTIKDLVPGTAYLATVWRFKNIYNRGRLAVHARGEDGFYLAQDSPSGNNKDGWELLEIRFHVPFRKKIDDINIHVFSDGTQEVFFDDLRIEKINQWKEEAFQPEILNLNVKKEALQKLKKKRSEALKVGILETQDDDWVSAEIEQENQTIPVKIRLKGDWLDHLTSDKWSFRVKTADAFSWNGLKTFSIHTPAARYYLHEWLLHRFWEKEDVLTPRYDFIELHLNGKSLGIYAYEEHFEKQLVEHKKRREGPILKLSEEGYWAGVKRQLEEHGYLKPGVNLNVMEKEQADIQAFKEKKWVEDSVLNVQLKQAKAKLVQFTEGAQPVASLFDLDRLARYYAISDVLNAYHGIVWHNQRFYYNPVIDKLEPIGFDGYGEKPKNQLSIIGQGALHRSLLEEEALHSRLFTDEAFVNAYVKSLHRFSNSTYFNQIIDSLYVEWQPRLEWLQMEFPSYKGDLKDFKDNAAFVHSLILPFNKQSLKVYTHSINDKKRKVYLKNTHVLPVEIVGYGINKKQPSRLLETPILLPGHKTRLMQARLDKNKEGKINDFSQLRFQAEEAMENQEVAWLGELSIGAHNKYIFYRPLGLDTLFYSNILNDPSPTAHRVEEDVFQNVDLEESAIFKLNGKQVIFKKGKYEVTKDIIIPNGYVVRFEAGVQLDFVQKAGFLSKSPVQLFGTEEEPIKIFSSDRSGGGFTVLQAEALSKLNYVLFEGMNTLSKGGWQLTGAVNFYESNVQIKKCAFKSIPCEDGLNIIRSTFRLEFCQFTDLFYDAFDSDFCKGTINNSYFYQIGNDAMDFSGSIVNIRSCRVDNSGDKGISVGEESDVNVFESSIENCPIAVASKDLSVLYIDNILLKNCEQGFVAFQKKPEFGGGQIIVKSYQANQIKRLHAISEGSSLQLEDQLIKN